MMASSSTYMVVPRIRRGGGTFAASVPVAVIEKSREVRSDLKSPVSIVLMITKFFGRECQYSTRILPGRTLVTGRGNPDARVNSRRSIQRQVLNTLNTRRRRFICYCASGCTGLAG